MTDQTDATSRAPADYAESIALPAVTSAVPVIVSGTDWWAARPAGSRLVGLVVARDDLPDGASWLYAETCRQIRELNPGCGVELLVERLPKSLGNQAKGLACLISLVFYGMLIWYGFEMVVETMDQESPALELPMGYVYLSIPLSAIVLFICEIKNVLDDLFGTQGEDESVKGE